MASLSCAIYRYPYIVLGICLLSKHTIVHSFPPQLRPACLLLALQTTTKNWKNNPDDCHEGSHLVGLMLLAKHICYEIWLSRRPRVSTASASVFPSCACVPMRRLPVSGSLADKISRRKVKLGGPRANGPCAINRSHYVRNPNESQ